MVQKSFLSKLKQWVKINVIEKFFSDVIVDTIKIILPLFLLYVISFSVRAISRISCMTDYPNVGTTTIKWCLLIIGVLSILLIITSIRYIRIRLSFYDNEHAALRQLRKDIIKAKGSIKIIGHGCINIFNLKDAYEKALRKGVSISVLFMNPDDQILMDKQKSLEIEGLEELFDTLINTGKIPNGLLEGITKLSPAERSVYLPIILSLKHGWYKLYLKNNI